MSSPSKSLLFAALLLAGACSTGSTHHGSDGGLTDAGAHEGGPSDGAPTDARASDGGARDAGPLADAGGMDASHDAGRDLGPSDLGPPDLGRDAGPPDLGPPDLGPPFDAGAACAVPLRIGLYAADDAPAHVTVKGFLDGTARFASVTIGGPVTTTPPVGPVPTLAQLDAFDAVLVWGSGSWDGTAFGNVLADYVDQGHGVVIMVFAERAGASVGVEGRMLSAGYLPYVPGTYDFGPRSLGAVSMPGHPIMAGVATFSGTNVAYHIGPLTGPATLVASTDIATPLVATTMPSAGRVVLLGFYPVRFWDTSTDGARLMANALHWSACGD